MPLYLGRFSYTPDAIKALLSQPEDRSAAAREVAESLGGKLLGFWYAFGVFDGVFLMEAPDNASAAALAMAVGAGGALSEVETTVLLDMDESPGRDAKGRRSNVPPATSVEHCVGQTGKAVAAYPVALLPAGSRSSVSRTFGGACASRCSNPSGRSVPRYG